MDHITLLVEGIMNHVITPLVEGEIRRVVGKIGKIGKNEVMRSKL